VEPLDLADRVSSAFVDALAKIGEGEQTNRREEGKGVGRKRKNEMGENTSDINIWLRSSL